MKLIADPRQPFPIEVSEEEILADLLYPAHPARARAERGRRRREGDRPPKPDPRASARTAGTPRVTESGTERAAA